MFYIYKKIALLLIIYTTLNSVNGQNLNGKWILKDIDSGNENKGYPKFMLLKINNECLEIYDDFDLTDKVSLLRIKNETLLNSNNERVHHFKVINDNYLKLFIEGESNDQPTVFEFDFYKLIPTITTLKKEEIEKMSFSSKENGRETEFIFNKELTEKEHLKLLNINEGEKKIIEKIDSTFFVSMYYNGKRNGSIPIEEVNTEFLKLYAIPTGPMKMILYRKK